MSSNQEGTEEEVVKGEKFLSLFVVAVVIKHTQLQLAEKYVKGKQS